MPRLKSTSPLFSSPNPALATRRCWSLCAWPNVLKLYDDLHVLEHLPKK
jgi:hypothetical protein